MAHQLRQITLITWQEANLSLCLSLSSPVVRSSVHCSFIRSLLVRPASAADLACSRLSVRNWPERRAAVGDCE